MNIPVIQGTELALLYIMRKPSICVGPLLQVEETVPRPFFFFTVSFLTCGAKTNQYKFVQHFLFACSVDVSKISSKTSWWNFSSCLSVFENLEACALCAPGEMKKVLQSFLSRVTSLISFVMLTSLPATGGTRRKSRILQDGDKYRRVKLWYHGKAEVVKLWRSPQEACLTVWMMGELGGRVKATATKKSKLIADVGSQVIYNRNDTHTLPVKSFRTFSSFYWNSNSSRVQWEAWNGTKVSGELSEPRF